MNKKVLNKQISNFAIIIFLSTAIFTFIGFVVNSNIEESHYVKYKLELNERVLIYLDSLDRITGQLKITVKKKDETMKLSSQIRKSIEKVSLSLNYKFPNVTNIMLDDKVLVFVSKKEMDFDKISSEMLAIVNKKIIENLNNRLLLYYDIGEENIKEQNVFNLRQLDKIVYIKSQGVDSTYSDGTIDTSKYLKLDGLMEFFIFNGVSQQTAEIDELKAVLKSLHISLTREKLALLRAQYMNAGVEDNLLLVRLKTLTEKVTNLEILEKVSLEKADTKKPSLLYAMISSGFIGLIFSLICIYFYLTVSISWLRKKLSSLHNLK